MAGGSFNKIVKETLRFSFHTHRFTGNAEDRRRSCRKVQRKGIYDTMARDIGLLHKAVKLVPPISIKETIDFSMVLDELWVVTQEEMNFLTEAATWKSLPDGIKILRM